MSDESRSAPGEEGYSEAQPEASGVDTSPEAGTPSPVGPSAGGPTPEAPPAFARVRTRTPRPILGPWLWVGGVLLWAYVVMGIFTTSRFGPNRLPLGEGAAVLGVLVAFASAGFFALQKSLWAKGGRAAGRASAIGFGALGFFMCFVLAAIFVAGTGIPDGAVTLLLLVASGASVWMGRRLTSGDRSRAEDNRAAAVGLWIAAAVVTFVALAVR